MHYVLAPRTFLFSHYFYTGLRIATGIVGLTFLTYAIADLPTAMAVAMGALCTSLMDLPSPLRHKFNEMLAGVLLCSLVALLVSLCSPVPWLLRSVIVLVAFLASMMVVYGRKAWLPEAFPPGMSSAVGGPARRPPLCRTPAGTTTSSLSRFAVISWPQHARGLPVWPGSLPSSCSATTRQAGRSPAICRAMSTSGSPASAAS